MIFILIEMSLSSIELVLHFLFNLARMFHRKVDSLAIFSTGIGQVFNVAPNFQAPPDDGVRPFWRLRNKWLIM